MHQPQQPFSRYIIASVALFAIVVGSGAAALAYTAGWFSPQRLAPLRIVDAFAPPSGPALGHRRNHAKGICFAGVFEKMAPLSRGNEAEASAGHSASPVQHQTETGAEG